MSGTAEVPTKKLTRGYLDGCYDLMHAGHYNALRQAKQLVDVLVVGVHSDDEIKANKGPPVMNNDERMALVNQCKFADEVVFGTPYSPTVALLDELNCDYCLHGDDISPSSTGEDAHGVLKKLNRMKIFKRTEGISTTALLSRILTEAERLEAQASGKAVPVSDCKQTVSTFLPSTWRLAKFSNVRQPTDKDKVIYLHGDFDLMHMGHIKLLEQARAMGTFLYVGLLSDADVASTKGRNCIMNLYERTLNVLSCKLVDDVIMGAPRVISRNMIIELGIDLVVSFASSPSPSSSPSTASSAAEEMEEPDEVYATPKALNIFHELKFDPSWLTTQQIIKRVADNQEMYIKRNAGRTVKEAAYYAGLTATAALHEV